jgi:hypothetical protein
MATIRKLRGRWQAPVRRQGIAPRAKSFNTKADALRWAQDLEAEANRSGWVADTRLAEKTTSRPATLPAPSTGAFLAHPTRFERVTFA